VAARRCYATCVRAFLRYPRVLETNEYLVLDRSTFLLFPQPRCVSDFSLQDNAAEVRLKGRRRDDFVP